MPACIAMLLMFSCRYLSIFRCCRHFHYFHADADSFGAIADADDDAYLHDGLFR